MNFSKEDQNTFLLVAAILVVCIVTVIIIFNLIWGIIAQPINDGINSVGNFFRIQQPVDYNFQVPAVSAIETPQANQNQNDSEQTNAIKYEMPYKNAQVLGSTSVNISKEPILKEALASRIQTGNNLTQIKFRVEIPSIGLDSPAMHGSDAQFILQNGFFIYPGSNLINKGEIILLCYRSQFKSTDPRSCWYLNKLSINDEIILDNSNGSTSTYKIIGTNTFNFSSDFIYKINNDENYLQIVTNDGKNRIVILAVKTII